jgi:hypothetical protein
MVLNHLGASASCGRKREVAAESIHSDLALELFFVHVHLHNLNLYKGMVRLLFVNLVPSCVQGLDDGAQSSWRKRFLRQEERSGGRKHSL